MSMESIEHLTEEYACARSRLAVEVQALQDEIEAVKRRRLAAIKAALVAARTARDDLQAEVENSPDLFKRPKSRIFHGVKVGFMKGKGKLVFANEAKVVAAIKRQLPDQAEHLIKVTEKPVRKALEQLDTKQLKRLGISIEETGDEVVIKPVDGDVDKLVSALLTDSELAQLQEEAA